MTTQPFENAPQQPDTAKPEPECPPATTAPQNGVQGRLVDTLGMDQTYGDTTQGACCDNPRDEYHTMHELYDYRMLYNAMAANAMPSASCKSWRHSDGEPCFGGGWFVVYITLPTGQVSNHYKAKYWDLFRVPEVDLPPEWDGHTPQVAAERMRSYLVGATQGRDAWADGYASARRFYGDDAPIALDKIRERIDQYRDEHGHRPPHMFDLDNLLEDIQDILDIAQEPK